MTGLVLGAASAAYVYVLTNGPKGPALSVSPGWITGVVEGDFVKTNSSWNGSIIRFFNATTYANESTGRTSILRLHLLTLTFYEGATGMVITTIEVTVEGAFSSDLHIGGLTLVYNQTGCPGAWAWGYAKPSPVNISYDPGNHQMIYVCNGVAAFTPTLENQTGQGAVYTFVFPALIEDHDPLGSNQFVGFRATVSGDFTPAVSVDISLQIVDVPGGM